MKVYKKYKDSSLEWLGKIPSHWTIKRSKWLFKNISEKNRPDAQLLSVTQDKGVFPRDQLEGRVVMPTGELVTFKFIQKGDFAISLRSFEGGIEYSEFNGLISPAYIVLRPKENFHRYYYKQLLKSFRYIEELNTAVSGIREGKSIIYEDFGELVLPVPPLEEQRAIVVFLERKLERINEFIARKKKLIELLQEQKAALIHQAVSKGLDVSVPMKDSGLEWLGKIPAHWIFSPIKRFAKVGNGSTPSRTKSSYWSEGSYPWLNSSQVNRSFIDSADQFVTQEALSECHLPIVKVDSVLMAITGQGKTRGMTAVLQIEATINQHLAFITPQKKTVISEYLHFALSAAYSELRNLSDNSGSTKGALTCDDIKKFEIPLPSLEEQQQILTFIERETAIIHKAISTIEQEIELILEYRTSLIADCVTGKIDVRTVQ
jgi:type I restriction enzyme, S subunit